MDVPKYINKTISSLKNEGIKNTLTKVWHRLEPKTRKAIMYKKKLRASVFNDDLDIIVATEDDIDEEYKDIWYTRKQALEKLRKGHILFLGKMRTTNICYGWVELESINIPWLEIKNLNIPSHVGYQSRSYVPPKYRGQRITTRCYKLIEQYLLENTPIKILFLITTPDNIAINRSVRLANYISCQNIKYIKIFGLKLYIVDSLESKESKIRKIFIHNPEFWNFGSWILKR